MPSMEEQLAAIKAKEAKMEAIEAQYMDAFKQYDANGDGMITVEEMTAALEANGMTMDEDTKKGLLEMDKDGDGKVSTKEWLKNFLGNWRELMETSPDWVNPDNY